MNKQADYLTAAKSNFFRTLATTVIVSAALLTMCAGNKPAKAQTLGAAVPYTYRNLPVGALGSNFGGIVHPKNGNVVYFRGDGGSYRWDATNNKWICISDSTPRAALQDDVTYYGGGGASALAIDPNDASANIVYMASLNEIFKSTNRGTTWTGTGLKRADGSLLDTVDNGDGRWNGERLQVDPNNSNIIYYASNNDGLWKNNTGGTGTTGWSQLSGFPWRGERNYGVAFVAVDKSSSLITVNGQSVSSRIYAGVSVLNSGGTDGGVYRSTDGGQNWSKVGGLTLGAIDWGQTAPNGTLYVTHSNGVAKIPAGQSNLVACTAPWSSEPTRGHGPLAVAQSDPTGNTLYVSIDAYTTDKIHVQDNRWNGNPISRSTDGGQTWSNINGTWNPATSNLTYTPDQFAHQVNWLAVSPTNANELWMGDDTQVYRTVNAATSNAASVTWTNPIAGFEGGTFAKGITPPSSAPVFGFDQDIGLFRFRDVNQYPNAGDLQRVWADASGADYCETDPNFIAYAGTNGASTYEFAGGVAVTTNNGTSWNIVVGSTIFGQNDKDFQGGRIAVGATKQSNGYPIIVHYPQGGGAPRYSRDWGATWSNVSGLRTGQIGWYYDVQNLIAADRVNGNKFYALERSNGIANKPKLLYSTNGGQSFTVSRELPLTWDHSIMGDIMAVPGREGEVLFNQVDLNSFSNSGDESLYRATGADTANPVVTPMAGMVKLYSFAMGKAAPGFSTPALYVFGRTNFGGVSRIGIFRSDDALAAGKRADMADATWTQIYNPDTDATAYGVLLRGKTTLQADRQTYGRVYFGTGGRGFWRGDPAGAANPTPTPTPVPTATPTPTPAAGSGTGLKGEYFNDAASSVYPLTSPFTGTPVLTRTDATVNFDWGSGSPATGVTADNFSVRWTGQVQAPVTGSYTFTITGDDGIRLYLGGVLVISGGWRDQGPTSYSYTTSLTAGQKNDIKVEFYERGGGATARLQWAYPGQTIQTIPTARLYIPAVAGPGPNLMTNPGFEADGAATQTPSGWSEAEYDGSWNAVTPADASYTESGSSNSGSFHGTHWRPWNYKVYTWQTKTSLVNGLYTARCWAKSSGGQVSCQLEAKDYGSATRAITLPVSGSHQLVEIKDINVTNGQCTVGIWSDANGNNWASFDDFEFFKQ